MGQCIATVPDTGLWGVGAAGSGYRGHQRVAALRSVDSRDASGVTRVGTRDKARHVALMLAGRSMDKIVG